MKKTLFTIGACAAVFATAAQADEPAVETYTANVVIPTSSTSVVGKNALLTTITPNASNIEDFLVKDSVGTSNSRWYGGTTGANGGAPESVVRDISTDQTTNLTSFNINSRNNVYGNTYGILVLTQADIWASATGTEGAKVNTVDVSLKLDSIADTTRITSVKYSLWKYQDGTATQVGDAASWTSAGAKVNADGIDVSGFKNGDALVLVLGETTNEKYWEDAGFTLGVVAKGTKPVPEPATATLSLLALAGLAARRRRK